jgi:hypothetical protein
MGRVLVGLLWLLFASAAEAQFICPTARTSPNDTLPEWTQSKPAQFSAFIDSNYATCFKRLTAATEGQHRVPLYSQLQAFNADGTKLLLASGQILNVNSWDLYKTFPHTANAMRWSPTDPNIIFYLAGNALKTRNIVTDAEVTLRTFSEYHALNNLEGHEEMSNDGRFIALQGYLDAGHTNANSHLFVYDVINNRKGTTRNGASTDGCGGADTFAMSPSGRYAIVQWGEPNSGLTCNMQAYDTAMVYVGQVACGGGHYDLTIDADSTEYAVFFTTGSGCSVDGDGSWNGPYLAKSKIPNGWDLLEAGNSPVGVTKLMVWPDQLGGGHVSGRAMGHGFVIASADAYGSETPRVQYDNEVVKVYLDSNLSTPHIERLADSRSYPGRVQGWPSGTPGCNLSDYWAQPHATVSRDGTRVIWGSAWGSTSTDCRSDTYYMDISNKGFNSTLVNLPVNTWQLLSTTAFKHDGTASAGFPHNSYSGGVFAPEFGSMMIFGGGDHGERLGNDVWMYNTATSKWYQWTLPDSQVTYPSVSPNLQSFRSYAGNSVPITDAKYLTHTKTGSQYQSTADPIVPTGIWAPLGTTRNDNPWSSHSYDQMAWNSRDRKFLYWGPNFCTGLCEGNPPDSLSAGFSQSALYFGAKSAHLFSPQSKRWENKSGNQAPDLYHQTGCTAYDPVRKQMLAVNRSLWASTGGGASDGRGRAMVQDSTGVWTAAALPPNTGNWANQAWANVTLTYVRSTGTFYTWYRGQMAEYNGASNTWSQVPTFNDPTHGNPGNVADPYTVYDSKSDKLLVRGARESSNFVPTWSFDIATRQWQKMNPATEPGDVTSGDWFTPLVYDPINNVFLMSRRATSGATGNGDSAVIGGSQGELWAYKLTAGSGAGTARLSTPPVVNPCSSNP